MQTINVQIVWYLERGSLHRSSEAQYSLLTGGKLFCRTWKEINWYVACVLIKVYSNLNIYVKSKGNGNDGRVLILEAAIYGSDYYLINLSNADTERF